MDSLDMRILELSASGFCCTQILASVAMDLTGRENPDLLRALNGFCGGIGGTGGLCGAFSGGVAFLGLHCGKGSEQEERDQELYPMVQELKVWFQDRWGSLNCSDLVGQGRDERMAICPGIMAEAVGKCLSLLESRGIDPEHGR